jgi:hypothetical protein
MSLVQINWYPDRKELRNFGRIALIVSIIVTLLLCVLKGLALQWALIILAAGFSIFLTSLLSTKSTRTIYLALILLASPIGLAVSLIIMAAFYFLLLTPLGLFFRLIKRDPLQRKFDQNAKSYWLTRRPQDSLERYFRQF